MFSDYLVIVDIVEDVFFNNYFLYYKMEVQRVIIYFFKFYIVNLCFIDKGFRQQDGMQSFLYNIYYLLR